MAGVLFVNPRSGAADPSVEELAAAARARDVQVQVLRDGDDPGELARAVDADVLGMAGGDGSLGAVADAAVERGLPFVAVPFGTRNHFARDLGLDRDDPLAALAAFDGEARQVDVGRVGDRLFLNNVSLGLYARLVHRRERHRRRSEALARLRALAVLARHPRPLDLTVDGERVTARVLLVANNAYRLDALSPGERERLDEGLLHLYASSGILRDGWRERSATRFVVDARRHRLRAAVDGEPAAFETPLELRVEPGALRVLVPPGIAAEDAA
ncbi:MAG TPA: diacylglycerol kinase family protein [Gaiellaceae bacterium]|nr:diacylglycerol kinase family protein [Gaiellaceae bacterium]